MWRRQGRPVSKLLLGEIGEVVRAEARIWGKCVWCVSDITARISKGTYSLGKTVEYFPTYLFKRHWGKKV